MMKNILLLLITSILVIGCMEEEQAPPPLASTTQDIYSLPIRWDQVNIDLKFSENFNVAELNIFDEMTQLWDDAVPNIDFFTYPIPTTTNKEFADLLDFHDSEFGIYKSYTWYPELSEYALAITQFFGRRRLAGTPFEYFEIVSADIIVNYRDFVFDPADINYDHYDLPTIILHEMGHFMGLKHSQELESIMYPSLDDETIKRDLEQHDIDTIQNLYAKSFKEALRSTYKNALTTDEPEGELTRWIMELNRNGTHRMFQLK